MGSTPTTHNLLRSDDFLTKRQLAEALNVPSTRLVDELMRRRKIPYTKLGHRTVRFNRARVLEALKNYEIRPIG